MRTSPSHLTTLSLHCSGAPPDLHSFPTRRSSDLRDHSRANVFPLREDGETGRSPSSRSEEHTSELQSRFDLVCRLLLEKKKYSNLLSRPHVHLFSWSPSAHPLPVVGVPVYPPPSL